MSELGSYVSQVRIMSRLAFMQRYTVPFLLVKLEDIAATPAQEEDWAGTTRMTRSLGKASSFPILRHNAAIYRVHELICKNTTDLGTRQTLGDGGDKVRFRVSVGRLEDNDVTLEGGAISKRHAELICTDKNAWLLADLGSRNGTTLNGVRLQPGQPKPVNFGDPITMGDMALMIIGAGALYEIVSKQLSGR